MHERRAAKIARLIAERPRSAYEIAQEMWGNVAVTQAYLTLSEVLGHVDLLAERGEIAERELGGVARFEPVRLAELADPLGGRLDVGEVADVGQVAGVERRDACRTRRRGSRPAARARSSAATAPARWRRSSGGRLRRWPRRGTARRARRGPCWPRSRRRSRSSSTRWPARPGRWRRHGRRPRRPTPSRRARPRSGPRAPAAGGHGRAGPPRRCRRRRFAHLRQRRFASPFGIAAGMPLAGEVARMLPPRERVRDLTA